MGEVRVRLAVVACVGLLAACAGLDRTPPASFGLGGIPVVSGPERPSAVVVFGDSLSDAGNAHLGSLAIRAPSPPYFHGRFSNGPSWVELLAAHYRLEAKAWLHGGSNFAVGGAKAGTGIEGLPHQLLVYLWTQGTAPPAPKTLFVLYGGGNDIRNALKDADPAPALAGAALALRAMIERLADQGATDFLVPNVPDRGRTPAARKRKTQARETDMTRAFNHGLAVALEDLPEHRPIRLVRVDFRAAADAVFRHPERFGFANASDPCLTGEGAAQQVCATPDRYAFWDDIHPTAAGHRFLARLAIAAWERPIPMAWTEEGAASPLTAQVERLVRAGLAAPAKE
jgi:outer membrane lipase/esterase